MEAIYSGPGGEVWKKSRIQIYGWEAFSSNVSTSKNTSRGPNANFPLIYDLRPNRFEQNQFVLYVERVPDEFQTEHIDWGFRVSGHATKYSEHSFGLTWWPNKIVTLRPELRFDHSYDTPAFNNGTRRNQLVASMDFIIHY
jgi:Putative beta-barrel porin-2, OmpL-like. bbp2